MSVLFVMACRHTEMFRYVDIAGIPILVLLLVFDSYLGWGWFQALKGV